MHLRWFCLALLCVSIPMTAAVRANRPPSFAIPYADARLDNGLRVVVSEDHTAPVLSLAIAYDVGSRNERPGHTGYAHLLEHMMFKGSQNVGPGEHFTLIFHAGGTMNATTSKDRTLYFETLPSNQLDLALFLESDRMRSLEVTQENLDNQRLAVLEEGRRRFENQAYGRSDDALEGLAYDDFAYQHPVIGAPADLEAARVEDVDAFFRAYYVPNNAVLAIVGDVDKETALSAVRRYFGSIHRQPGLTPISVPKRPQADERRQVIVDRLAPKARVDVAYKTPSRFEPGDAELALLASILGTGRSARLERLVREKAVASSVSATSSQGRAPGLFRVTAVAAPGVDATDVESAIYDEIARIQAGDVEAWEIEKARALAQTAYISALRGSASRATLLAEHALFYDNPALVSTGLARLASVRPSGVTQVARRYLTRERRSVVVTKPPATAKGER